MKGAGGTSNDVASWRGVEHGPLEMWVVYDHPLDRPHEFVARKWSITAAGAVATTDLLASSNLDTLQTLLGGGGLVRLERSAGDEPHILEVWL